MGEACCPGANGGAGTCTAGDLICGGNNQCGPCGAAGQACCPDPTGAQQNGLCGTGTQCIRSGGGGNYRCATCGGKGQACCGTSANVSMRTCTAGTCQNNGVCP
jgi:hypothetical protein